MDEFSQDRPDVLERASRIGIRAILCPADATSPESLKIVLGLRGGRPDVIAAAGIHPHQAKNFCSGHLALLRGLAAERKIRAVGEIGLDFHYNFSPPKEQSEAFRSQLRLAQELGLPVVIHSRNAAHEVQAAVEEEHFRRGGVLHCFSETWEMAQRMLREGFYISFSGIITIPKASAVREVAQKVPLDRLLIETDSPYLVPVPFRGVKKRNEPAFVVEVARTLAELKNISISELAAATSRNFDTLFCV
jgi:TatD DNase family protein